MHEAEPDRVVGPVMAGTTEQKVDGPSPGHAPYFGFAFSSQDPGLKRYIFCSTLLSKALNEIGFIGLHA